MDKSNISNFPSKTRITPEDSFKKSTNFTLLTSQNKSKETENQKNKISDEENSIKDSYSIDNPSSLSLDEKSDRSKHSISPSKKLSLNSKDKIFFDFLNCIEIGDINRMNLILKSPQNHHFINRVSPFGFTPIQYAAFYGQIDVFKFLLDHKAQMDKTVEGLDIIHLSLTLCIFKKHKKKCAEMFSYIYHNFPEQKKSVDRLGRNYLHIIFQYDFDLALESIDYSFDDLFAIDNNGDYVINYAYIYNSNQCFFKLSKNYDDIQKLYLTIRDKYSKNPDIHYIRKEKFLENCLIHHAFQIIGFLILNCLKFKNEIKEDLDNILKYYSGLHKEFPENEGISNIYFNTKASIENWESLELVIANEVSLQFNYKYVTRKTALIYNKDNILHIQLPEEPVKHFSRRAEMFENSDRLSCLVAPDKGIIVSDFLYDASIGQDFSKEINTDFFILRQTTRKACLNDILKCHDINYIHKLKEKCESLGNNNQNKKKDNHHSSTQNLLYTYEQLDCDTWVNKYTYENIFNTAGCVFDAIDTVMKKEATNAFALIRPPGHHAGFFGPVENPVTISNGFCIINNVCVGAAYARYFHSDKIKRIAIFDFDVHHGNGTEEIVQMLNHKKFHKIMDYEKFGKVDLFSDIKINWFDFDDAKNTLFISTHIFNEQNPKTFYPYSGSAETNTSKEDEIYPGGILNIPFGFKSNYSYEYRKIIRNKVIPRLCKFKPDIIFLSAGFDGHELEGINQKHMSLQEYDYAFVTEKLQIVADKYCEGRLVSVLEGGYNVTTGLISSFAQSVFCHARFLNLSINVDHVSDVNLSLIERRVEYNNDLELFKKIQRFEVKPRRSERIKHMGEEKDEDDKRRTRKSYKESINNNGGANSEDYKNFKENLVEESEGNKNESDGINEKSDDYENNNNRSDNNNSKKNENEKDEGENNDKEGNSNNSDNKDIDINEGINLKNEENTDNKIEEKIDNKVNLMKDEEFSLLKNQLINQEKEENKTEELQIDNNNNNNNNDNDKDNDNNNDCDNNDNDNNNNNNDNNNNDNNDNDNNNNNDNDNNNNNDNENDKLPNSEKKN